MADWSEIISNIERITFKVSTEFGHGTGFVVDAYDGTLMIATAWHVINKLSSVKDKYARFVQLVAATGATAIEANSVGVARLGPEGSDTGIVWVGKPFSQQAVDRILSALANSDINDGLLDISGGGGVVKFFGEKYVISSENTPAFSQPEKIFKGMNIGWIGYPSVAPNSACFFSGTIAGYKVKLRKFLEKQMRLTRLRSAKFRRTILKTFLVLLKMIHFVILLMVRAYLA